MQQSDSSWVLLLTTTLPSLLCTYRIVTGTKVGVTNIKYRTLEFTRDTTGFSTQMLTLNPLPETWASFTVMDPASRLAYESLLAANRPDLRAFFEKEFDRQTLEYMYDVRRARVLQ